MKATKRAERPKPSATGERATPQGRAARVGPVAWASLVLCAALCLYGFFLDRSIRPDPFDPAPGLWDYLFHREPDPALATLPVVPLGAGGTLTFRPLDTAVLNSPVPRGFEVAALPSERGFAQCLASGERCWLAPAGGASLLGWSQDAPAWRPLADFPIGVSRSGQALDDVVAFAFDEAGQGGWLLTRDGALRDSSDGGATWSEPQRPYDVAQAAPVSGPGAPISLVERWSLADGERTVTYLVVRSRGASALSPQEAAAPLDLSDLFATGVGQLLSIGADGRVTEAATDAEGPPGQFLFGWVTRPEAERQAWLVGARGALVQVTGESDGKELRAAWRQRDSGTQATLRSLFFTADGQTGWASSGWDDGGEEGARPVILQTLDGGETWRRLGYAVAAAPWVYWLALPALLLALVNFGLAWNRQRRASRLQVAEGIDDSGHTDRPIGWGDADVLGLRPIAKAVSRLLRNMATLPPLTIAVTGPWGSGKSSLMNLVAEDLRRFDTRPVWFNAWHHQQEENLLAALLEAIRVQAFPSFWRWDGFRFRLALVVRRSGRSLGFALLALVCVGLLVLLLSLADAIHWAALPHLFDTLTGDSADEPWSALAGLLGLPLTAVATVLTLIRLFRVLPFHPAQLIAGVSDSARVKGFADRLSFRYRFAAEFALVCRALRQGPGAGVVIVIDDLDRCRPDQVMTVLEAVNFLMTAGDCFILLGMDLERVIHSVAASYKDTIGALPSERLEQHAPVETLGKDALALRRHAEQYLEKLINIVIPVPPATESATRDLLRSFASGGAAREAGGGVAPASRAVRGLLAWTPVPLAALLLAGIVGWGLYGVAQALRGEAPALAVAAPGGTEIAGEGGRAAPADEGPDLTVPPLPAIAVPPATDAPPWKLAGLVLVAVGVLALLLRQLSRPPEQEIDDSRTFKETLARFSPVFHAAGRTPRGVKRLQNHLRFLAMLDRPQREAPDWLSRVLAGRAAAPPDAPAEPHLEDGQIVALGSVAALLRRAEVRGGLDQALARCFGAPQNQGTLLDLVGRDDLAVPLAAVLGEPLDPAVRPDAAAIERFLDLARIARSSKDEIRSGKAPEPKA